MEAGAGDIRPILTALVYLSNRKLFTGAGKQACKNRTEECTGSLWAGVRSLGNSLLLSLGFLPLCNDQSDHDPKGAEASWKRAEASIATFSVIRDHAQKLPLGAHRLLNGGEDGKRGLGLSAKQPSLSFPCPSSPPF